MAWPTGLVMAMCMMTAALAGTLGEPGPSRPEEVLTQTDAATDPAWPVAGSHATYRLHASEGSPHGDARVSHDLEVTFTFDGHAWTSTCKGERRVQDDSASPPESVVVEGPGPAAPPLWPTQFAPQPRGPVLAGCSTMELGLDAAVRGKDTWSASRAGCPCQERVAEWSATSGLLRSWAVRGTAAGAEGVLVATDAT